MTLDQTSNKDIYLNKVQKHIHCSLKTYEHMLYKHQEYSSKNIILDVIHDALQSSFTIRI